MYSACSQEQLHTFTYTSPTRHLLSLQSPHISNVHLNHVANKPILTRKY